MNPSFPRLTGVELRKMVDTRAGFWLQLIVAVLTLAVVVLVCIFAPTDEIVFRDFFALAITPASILLPIVGILLVSSEWSQRTALITFTLVPQRMRVMGAKIAAGVALSLVVAALAFIVAVIANLAVGDEWTMGFAVFGQIVLLLLFSILGRHRVRRGLPQLGARDRALVRAAARVERARHHPVARRRPRTGWTRPAPPSRSPRASPPRPSGPSWAPRSRCGWSCRW